LQLSCKELELLHGHPLTSQRRLLLRIIHQANGHVDARELYQRASSRDGSISMATVYRSLNLFDRLGLVDEIRLGSIRRCYEIKQPLEHQHLLCQCCGKAIEFETSLIRKLVDMVQREQGFTVSKVDLCLEGYCAECKEKEKKR